MGPRPVDRGIVLITKDCLYPGNWLQWVHGRLTVVSIITACKTKNLVLLGHCA
jgi:hypothetical protein